MLPTPSVQHQKQQESFFLCFLFFAFGFQVFFLPAGLHTSFSLYLMKATILPQLARLSRLQARTITRCAMTPWHLASQLLLLHCGRGRACYFGDIWVASSTALLGNGEVPSGVSHPFNSLAQGHGSLHAPLYAAVPPCVRYRGWTCPFPMAAGSLHSFTSVKALGGAPWTVVEKGS